MSKILYIYILCLICYHVGPALAEQPKTALDDTVVTDAAPAVDMKAPSSQIATSGPSEQPSGQTYIYDLKKLIAKSRDNIKRVNEKIKEQAVVKRNQKREEKAREYYEKGNQLTDEGKLDEAREYFEKAIRITEHAEMVGYITQSERRLKMQESALNKEEQQRLRQSQLEDHSRQLDTNTAYTQAVALYKEKKFNPAKEAFAHVEEQFPDYKATRSYLKIIDQDIIQADEITAKNQKKEMERQQKEAEVARSKEKEAWRREIERKEIERKEQINKQAEDVYKEAIDLYKERKFKESKQKFQEVQWVITDYKAVNDYLKHIDLDIDEEQKRLAQQEEKDLKEQRWQEEITRKKEEQQRLNQLMEKERAHKKQLEAEAGFLYEAAVALFDKRQMDLALEKFNDIEKIAPDFKSTKGYMARISKWQFEEQKREDLERQRRENELALERQRRADEERQRILEEKKAREEAERIRQRQRDEETQEMYNAAVNEYKIKNLDAAKEGFLKLNEKSPNYKLTADYLIKIDAQIDIAQKEKERRDKERAERERQRIDEELRQLAQRQKAIEEAERQRQLDEETQGIYDAALNDFKLKNYEAAKKGFLQVQEKNPQYKLTSAYLIKTDTQMAIVEHEKEQAKRKALKLQRESMDELQRLYTDGINFYNSKNYDAAKRAFMAVSEKDANYKLTSAYMIKTEAQIEVAQSKAKRQMAAGKEASASPKLLAKPADTSPNVPAPVKVKGPVVVTPAPTSRAELVPVAKKVPEPVAPLEKVIPAKVKDEAFTPKRSTLGEAEVLEAHHKQQVGDMAALAERFGQLYRQMEGIADDRSTQTARKKIAQVQAVFENQKREKEIQLEKTREGKIRRQREETVAKEAIERKQAETNKQAKAHRLYEEAIEALRNGHFEKAKIEFQGVEYIIPDYKATRQYLSRIDQDKRKAEIDAFTQREREEAKRLASLQEKEKQEEVRKKAEKEQRERKAQQEQRAQIEMLSSKTVTLNEEILRLFKSNDYEALKIKFTELEGVVAALKNLKEETTLRQDQQDRQKELAREFKDQRVQDRRKKELIQSQERERNRVAKERSLVDKERQRRDEEYRFRKVKPTTKSQGKLLSEKLPTQTEGKTAVTEAAALKPINESGMTEEQKQAQKDLSTQRKKFFNQKYEGEQQQKAFEVKVKEEKELQDKRRRQIEQEQEAMRMALVSKTRLEREARQRQMKLNAAREDMRKKLVKGVDDRYLEGVMLFKQRKFSDALAKFQDVNNVFPNYKNSRKYIIQAQQQLGSLGLSSTEGKPLKNRGLNTWQSQKLTMPTTPKHQPLTQQEAVSRALDLFDPNVK